MKITVLGANGKTGREVVTSALTVGIDVVGVARGKSVITTNAHFTAVQGDATDPTVIAKASKNSDVIISTLGTMSNKSTVITDSVKAVLTACTSTGTKRFILLSSFAARQDQLSGVTRFVTSALMKGVIADKQAGERLLMSSNLDWTIVYATRLTDGPQSSDVRIVGRDEKLSLSSKITRVGVAEWIVREAQERAYAREQVVITQ